jgi:hypothetical protein
MHGGAAPQVVRKAQERLADLIDPDRALREAACLAYSDIRAICDTSGRILPIQEWPDHVAAAVSSIEARATVDGTAAVLKVKLWEKAPALALIFKRLGLLERAPAPDQPRTVLRFVVEHRPGKPLPESKVISPHRTDVRVDNIPDFTRQGGS